MKKDGILVNIETIYGVNLTDEQIVDAVEPAVKKLLKTRSDGTTDTEDGDVRPAKVLDWRDADADGDRRLSTDELKDLIKMLRGNPEKFMFDSEVGMNILTIDHPDFRSRVLFLADNCEL